MSGPTVTVQLDASAVAGLLVSTGGVRDAAEAKGLTDLVEQMRSMRLALTGALRAAGWTPCADDPNQWEMRPASRHRRR